MFLCGTLLLPVTFSCQISPYDNNSIRFVPRPHTSDSRQSNPGAERAAFRQKMSDAWLIEPIGSGFLKCSILLILCSTMTGNFTRRTARRIRQLGYAPKRAIWFAGFFFFSLLSVCAALGLLTSPTEGRYGWITGSGKSPAGPRAGSILPDVFGLRRY